MRCALTFVLAAVFVVAQQPGAKLKPPPAAVAAGFESISVEDCKTWLAFLAGPECEGRGTGQDGYQKAADYVAERFREFGLKPVGDKGQDGKPSYFQMVPFTATGIDPTTCSLEVVGKTKTTVPLGEGFGVSGSGAVECDAPAVFLAASATSREEPEVDVEGKAVILLAYGDDGGFPPEIRFLNKLRGRKPAAILRINNVSAARGAASAGGWSRVDPKRPPRDDGEGGGRRGATPSTFISEEVLRKLAEAGGVDVEKLVADARRDGGPKTKAAPLRIKLKAKSKRLFRDVPNVVGYLEGSDPKLKKEVVIFGSHLDHLGRRDDGAIFFGADDDGSGSTGLIAIARAFTKNARAPKRSVLFLAVCGEEIGLLGSDWYVEHPIFPIEDTVAELQMDMIGRREEAHDRENPGNEKAEDNVNTLHVVGSTKISTQLHEIILKANADHIGFDFEYDGEKYYTRSDHYNFARKGIPVAFVFTGVHRDYHEVSDTPDKIDYPKLARVAQLMYLVGFEVADRAERLVKDVKSRK
ncbi:MAG TPA: M28 family peptidase [Planctomycetota bacterium]|nr:M28 family peptidase [Planctomycetota bacterium]